MSAPRRGGRRRLALVVVLGAAIVAGGLAAAIARGLLLHDSAKPVSIEDAIRGFRAEDRAARALEGVYVYATDGEESIDAFAGARHRYPAETGITVVRVPCGLRLGWSALQDRSTTWTFCSTPAGIELRSFDEVHRFFGQTDHTAYDCVDTVLLPAGGAAAESRPFDCRTNGGGQRGTVQVVGAEEVAADGGTRSSIHVRTVVEAYGANSGTETVDWWLDARNALPLRIAVTSRTGRRVLVMKIHYREDLTLVRTSATPRR